MVKTVKAADELLVKLHEIKALADELPTLDDLEALTEAASNIVASLERAKELWSDGDLPSVDSIEAVASPAGELVSSLEQVKTLWTDGDLPTADEIDEIANPARELVASLKEAAELS